MGENNIKDKKVNKPAKQEYTCPICRQQHEKNRICPIVNKKLHNSKPENRIYIFGNIILECIKKKINYQIILKEIAYLEMLVSKDWMRMFNADLLVNYFATAIECSPINFLKKSKKTNEEYASLLEVDYSDDWEVIKGDDGKTECVIMPVNIEEYSEVLEETCKYRRMPLSLCKEKKDKEWEYILKLNDAIIKFASEKLDQADRKIFDSWYYMFDMNLWSSDFTLTIDKNGKLKDFFEKNIRTHFTKIAQIVSVSDTRFHIWVEKLTKATKQGLIDWKKQGCNNNIYSGYYAEKEIEIRLRSDIDKKDILYIRFDWDFVLGYTILAEEMEVSSDQNNTVKELRELTIKIEKSIEIRKNNSKINDLPQRKIEYSDAVTVSNSIICKCDYSTITPYKGLVPFLNNENTLVTYTVYVGYCEACKRFYMFVSDFMQMLKEGKPLCRIIRLDKVEIDDEKLVVGFKYKSESILHALGYNVCVKNNLNNKERQKILADAIEHNLLQAHEILEFLNWLVKLKDNQSKYANAVSLWKQDIAFVQKYMLSTADTMKVSSIIVKG